MRGGYPAVAAGIDAFQVGSIDDTHIDIALQDDAFENGLAVVAVKVGDDLIGRAFELAGFDILIKAADKKHLTAPQNKQDQHGNKEKAEKNLPADMHSSLSGSGFGFVIWLQNDIPLLLTSR